MASAADVANRIPITIALMLATLMNTLDSTIANVALPHMQGSLGASQDQITWVLTSYIVATAIMTPLSGWLSMKVGRKPMFLLSIFAFTVASMLCGAAQSLGQMVLFRLIQGVAGATLMPLSQSVMLDIFPLSRLSQVMSVWSAVVVIGPIIGPVLGGWITESFTWRYVFYINLPVGILAFLGLYLFMDRDRGGRQRPFDFLGLFAVITFVGAFQLMVDRGPSQDWFNSREIWVEGIVGVIGLYVLVVQTMSAPHPFFPRALAMDRNFVTSTLFTLFVGVLLFSTSALLPQLMQNLLGYSALQSGLASMPRGVGSFIGFLFVPLLVNRLGAKPVLVMGVIISALALWQMAHFDLSMTAWSIQSSGFIQGLGVGFLFAPLTVVSFATLAPTLRTEGAVVGTMVRALGSSLGISVLQASLLHDAALAHARLAEKFVPGNPVTSAMLPPPGPLGPPGGLALLNGEVTRQATMLGYNAIFAWMALLILLLIPLLAIMRPPRMASMGVKLQGQAD